MNFSFFRLKFRSCLKSDSGLTLFKIHSEHVFLVILLTEMYTLSFSVDIFCIISSTRSRTGSFWWLLLPFITWYCWVGLGRKIMKTIIFYNYLPLFLLLLRNLIDLPRLWMLILLHLRTWLLRRWSTKNQSLLHHFLIFSRFSRYIRKYLFHLIVDCRLVVFTTRKILWIFHMGKLINI